MQPSGLECKSKSESESQSVSGNKPLGYYVRTLLALMGSEASYCEASELTRHSTLSIPTTTIHETMDAIRYG